MRRTLSNTYYFDVLYIPLVELASIEMEAQSELAAGASCNNMTFTAHDLYIKTVNGQSIKTKVLNPQKAMKAFERISELNASVYCAVTGNTACFASPAC